VLLNITVYIIYLSQTCDMAADRSILRPAHAYTDPVSRQHLKKEENVTIYTYIRHVH